MKCPVCEEKNLDAVRTASGTVHRCSECGHIFILCDMLARFSNDSARFQAGLREAQSFLMATGRLCPNCQQRLQQGRVPASGAVLTLCPSCNALWIEPWQLYDLDPIVARALQTQLQNPSMPIAPPPTPVKKQDVPPPLPKKPDDKPVLPWVPPNVVPPNKEPELPPKPSILSPARKPILWPEVPRDDDFSAFLKPDIPPGKAPETPKKQEPPPEAPPPKPVSPPKPVIEPKPIPPFTVKAESPPVSAPVTASVPPPAAIPVQPPGTKQPDSRVGGFLRLMARALERWADTLTHRESRKPAKTTPAVKPAALHQPPLEIKKTPPPVQPAPAVEVKKPAPIPKTPPPAFKPAPVSKIKKPTFWSGLMNALREAWSPSSMSPPEKKSGPPAAAAPVPAPAPAPEKATPSVVAPSPSAEKPVRPAPKPAQPEVKKEVDWMGRAALWTPRVLPWAVYVLIGGMEEEWGAALTGAIALWSSSSMWRLWWMYPSKPFKEFTVQELAAATDVLIRRGLPVQLKGRLAAEGSRPGPLNFEDPTGTIALNRLGPLELLPRVLGLTSPGQYPKGDFTVKGWYRKAKTPFIEVVEARDDKSPRKSLVNGARWLFAAAVLGLSILLFLVE